MVLEVQMFDVQSVEGNEEIFNLQELQRLVGHSLKILYERLPNNRTGR